MKQAKVLLVALAFTAVASLLNQASAFPLQLTSVSGTITYTASYSALTNSSGKYATKSVSMKFLMSVVSNSVYRITGTNTPSDAKIMFDPYANTVILTNRSGYSFDLEGPGIVHMRLEDIATSFHSSGNGVSESDVILGYFYIDGTGTDGYVYDVDIFGQGTLSYSADAKTGTKGSMTISFSGSNYGEYHSSDDGVAKGSVTFKGTGAPEWSGAFATWWY